MQRSWTGIRSQQMVAISKALLSHLGRPSFKDVFPNTTPKRRAEFSRRLKVRCVKEEDPIDEIGFGFSAGGMVFPYFIGVVDALHENGILTRDTKMAGSSAGSLISAFYHAGITTEALMDACFQVLDDCREYGTRGRLRGVLERVTRDMLPEDAHERCTGKAFISITRLYPFGNHLISEFDSRDDLISALLASCHVPVWFDRALITKHRDGFCMDGGLTNFIPNPPVPRTIRVSCFPMRGWGEDFKVKIAPDRYRESKYSVQELLAFALSPADESTLLELFENGRRDVDDYMARYTLPSLDEEESLEILVDDEDESKDVGANLWKRMRSVISPRNKALY